MPTELNTRTADGPPLDAVPAGAPLPSPSLPSPSLTLPATIIAGIFGILLLALTGLLGWQAYQDTLNQTRTRAAVSAQVVATQAQWLVGASRQALEQLDLAITGVPAELTEHEKAHIRSIAAQLPGGLSAWVLDARGLVVHSTGGAGADFSDGERIFFQALREGEAWYISSLIVLPPSGEQVFVVARRLERAGAFAGAAAIVIPAGLMSEFWSPLDLGADSTVSLFRDDGWLVARFPPSEGPLNLANYVLFTEHLKRAAAGSYDAVSPADGVTRIVGYRRVEGLPLVALASISTEHALAPFWRTLYRVAAVLGPAFVALAVGLAWLVSLLKRDQRRKLELAAALERNQLLLRELHHRVKNNLQAVQGLLQLQPIAAEAKREMGNRIAAMMAMHEQAYRTDQFGHVDLADYLERLAANLRASYAGKAEVDCRTVPVAVDRDIGLPLGLLANELISNALKHAFPDGRPGRVEVRLARHGSDAAELSVSDDGVGFDPAASHSGMGSRLIRGLAAQIGSAVEQQSGGKGSRFTIRFPAASGRAAAG